MQSIRCAPSLKLFAILVLVLLLGSLSITPSTNRHLLEIDDISAPTKTPDLSERVHNKGCEIYIVRGPTHINATLNFYMSMPIKALNETEMRMGFYEIPFLATPDINESVILIHNIRSYPFLYTDGSRIFDRYLEGPSACDINVTYHEVWNATTGVGYCNHQTVSDSNLTHHVQMGMYLLLDGITVKNATRIYTCCPSSLLFKVNWTWAPTSDNEEVNLQTSTVTVWDSYNKSQIIGTYTVTLTANFPETYSTSKFPVWEVIVVISVISITTVLLVAWRKRSIPSSS